MTLKNSILEKCKAYLPRKWLCELENCTYSIKKNSLKFIFGCNILTNTIHSCKILWQKKENNVEFYIRPRVISLSRKIRFWWISTEACYKNNFTSSNLDVTFNFVIKTIRINGQPSYKTHSYICNLPIEIVSCCDVLASRESIRLINYTTK